jgi:hypothetical protein
MDTRQGLVVLTGFLMLGLLPFAASGHGKTTLSGFVDTSSFYESAQPSNTFSLDQVELDVDSELNAWAGLRLDLNFNTADSGKDIRTGIFDELTADDVLEQGFLYLVLPTKAWGFETIFFFGKFTDVSPVGWEGTDPLDVYQFSFALVSDFGIPNSLTGALLAVTLHPVVGLQLYAVNGWDTLRDNNTMKTFGARLDLTPLPDLNWGLNVVIGPEQDDQDEAYRTLFDTDLLIELIPRLLIGAEFTFGHEENVASGGKDAFWLAGLLTLRYELTSLVGFTWRFDIFDDRNGVRLDRDNEAVTRETRYALTLASTFALAERARLLVELRYAQSDANVFATSRDSFTDHMFSVAVELTLAFAHVLP